MVDPIKQKNFQAEITQDDQKVYSNQIDSEVKQYFLEFEKVDLQSNFSNFFLMGEP